MASAAYLFFILLPSNLLFCTSCPMESHLGLELNTSTLNDQVPQQVSLDLSLKLGSDLYESSHNNVKRFTINEKLSSEHGIGLTRSRTIPFPSEFGSLQSNTDSRHQEMYLDKGSIPRPVHSEDLFNLFPTVPRVFWPKMSSSENHQTSQGKATQASLDKGVSIMYHGVDSSQSYIMKKDKILGAESQNTHVNFPTSHTKEFGKQKKTQDSTFYTHIVSSSKQRNQETPMSTSFDPRQSSRKKKTHTYVESRFTQQNLGMPMNPTSLIKKLVRHGRETVNAEKNVKRKLDLWFVDLENEIKSKLEMSYRPEEKMYVSIQQAVQIAKSKVVMGFIACLEFLYLKPNQDLKELIAKGWEYTSKILENWKTINLGTLSKDIVNTLGSSPQDVDAHDLLHYLMGLAKGSTISLQLYCNLYNTWVKEANKDQECIVKVISRVEFVQKIEKAIKNQENILKDQIRLLEPSMVNFSHQEDSIKRERFDVMEVDENMFSVQNKKQCQRSIRDTLQDVGVVWNKMSKPSDHLQSFYKWLDPLLTETHVKFYESRSLSSFTINTKLVFMRASKNLVSYFLTILVLLQQHCFKETDQQVMIDGLNFLKYYLEHWRHADLEKVFRIQSMVFNEFGENLKPSVLLRYAIEVPISSGVRLSSNILWGMWKAWAHWDESKISNKAPIRNYSEFSKKLGEETSGRLDIQQLPSSKLVDIASCSKPTKESEITISRSPSVFSPTDNHVV